jgi:hypothetical protein
MKNQKPKFKVGDAVSFQLVSRRAHGVIVEDRGNLGVGRQRVYDVLVKYDSSDPMHFEMEEEYLQLEREARPVVSNRTKSTKGRVHVNP